MNKKIGIIGNGFVGNAIRQGLIKAYPDIMVNDIKPEKSSFDLDDIVDQCKFIFICVNTPMRESGECFVGNIETVLDKIRLLQREYDEKIIILKSTVPPGTTERFQKNYTNMSFVFNPEFLTEANAVRDFAEQDRIILGGSETYSKKAVAELYYAVFPDVPFMFLTSREAEMVKYVGNTFLMTKVIYANEIHKICQELGIDYTKVINAATLDKRLGLSHWQVPGPDGDFGAGGTCFIKDINALIFKSESVGISVPLLKTVKSINEIIRTNKNWEVIK